MFEGVLLDFYGTVVHEDDVVIAEICDTISCSTTRDASPPEIGSYWWAVFSKACTRSHGNDFETQRSIELSSLLTTIEHFRADCDADALSELLFEHWRCPPIFDDALVFLDALELPVAVVSNIDRSDIEAAVSRHGLGFDHLVTSEDVRSYKPRPEPFLAGLAALGQEASRVLHIGDSPKSDVAGAASLGIPSAWVNRAGRPLPEAVQPDYEVGDLASVLPVLSSKNFYEDESSVVAYLAHRHSPVSSPNLVMENPAFTAEMGDLGGLRILDLGCGDGTFARACVHGGCSSYVGLDSSSEMIRRATDEAAGPKVRFIEAGIDLPPDTGIDRPRHLPNGLSLC